MQIEVVARPEGVYIAPMDKGLVSLTGDGSAETAEGAPAFAANPDALRDCAAALEFDGGSPLRLPPPPAGHTVYFVGTDDGPIKIGWTQQPIKERLKCLQSGSPVPLKVLALLPGVRRKELWYHRRFAAHRLHGEWFARHPDILDEIERLNSPLSSAFVRAAFGSPVQGGTPEHLGRFG